MKLLIVLSFVSLISGPFLAQDLPTILKSFEKATLPYQFPEGATSTFGDEESEIKYPAIDLELFNKTTQADLPIDVQLYSVDKMQFDNFYLLVILEVSVNINDGMENHSFVYYTLDTFGKVIDSRYACRYTMRDNFDSFFTMESSANISKGEYAGEEDLLIVETITEEEVVNTEGDHGMRRKTITSTYEAIDSDGKISDITSPL